MVDMLLLTRAVGAWSLDPGGVSESQIHLRHCFISIYLTKINQFGTTSLLWCKCLDQYRTYFAQPRDAATRTSVDHSNTTEHRPGHPEILSSKPRIFCGGRTTCSDLVTSNQGRPNIPNRTRVREQRRLFFSQSGRLRSYGGVHHKPSVPLPS